MNSRPLKIFTYATTTILTFLVLILFMQLGKVEAYNGTNSIPQWVKQDAEWWHDGKISDSEFISSLTWLVGKKIIPIQPIVLNNNTQDKAYKFKEITYYWSKGKISDKDFVSTVKYFIKNGGIKINDDFGPNTSQQMKALSVTNETERSVVVVPILTSSAYSEKGFYAHYKGECSRCLTVKIRDDVQSYVASSNGLNVLKSLGYKTITDVDIDLNPKILSQYDEVILLHNEYVTQREYDAITKHPHVLYLYPNALYAKVSIDYWNNTVTLVRGHGYPDNTITNGFGWKFDHSKLEYDNVCDNWRFDKIHNGLMLNCYPESRLNYDMALLQGIKDF